jgi:hypothetical protein
MSEAERSSGRIADGLAKIAAPRATIRRVQDIDAAHIAADTVDRRHPCVALNLDLDIEKERGCAASLLSLRAARPGCGAHRHGESELRSLIIAAGKRVTLGEAHNYHN